MTDTTAIATIDKSLEIRGLTQQSFRVLCEAVWPGASERAVLLAFDYCKARLLDPFKKPVHIVKTYRDGAEVETFWPGISEIRTTAMRTKNYAGRDETKFGLQIIKHFKGQNSKGTKTYEADVTFPEWAQVTVYRFIEGQRCAFPGPRVYWLETFSEVAKGSGVPNVMWRKRPIGQIDKCAEASSLRAAFPEEIGDQHIPEEMEGKTIDGEHETLPPMPALPAANLTQEETDALMADIEAEIDSEMDNDSPPAAGPAPDLEPAAAPAVPARPTTGGEARTDGRNRRGAQKQSATPPAPPAAGPGPSGEKGEPSKAHPSGGGSSQAPEPRPATDEQIGRIEKAVRTMKPGTAAEFITWAKEMFGGIGEDYLQYTYEEAMVAEGWIESKRAAAKAARE